MLTRSSTGLRQVDIGYTRPGFTEAFRQALRATDFLLLLFALYRLGIFPSLRAMRRHVLVELGPGPTRLAGLKSALLKDLCFVDQSDFGKPDKRLRFFDLNSCGDISNLIYQVIGLSGRDPILLFADHCIEHVTREVVSDLFLSLSRTNVTVCFRVPNIVSPRGQRNYGSDSTHRTPFDTDFREMLRKLGFHVIPFVRWYRPRMMVSFLLQPERRMGIADEIVIYKRSGISQV